jgi:two-component system, OmpR family, alkaline phosphatase synthesis response regulator PhoP
MRRRKVIPEHLKVPESKAHSRTILVIDDDVPTLELLTAAFGLEGYRVVDAVNGREGLQRLLVDRPDVVLCDILMPVLDGRGVSEAMHSQVALRDIPLVMLSAGQQARVATNMEYTAFVEKPFSLTALVDLVNRLVEQPLPSPNPRA